MGRATKLILIALLTFTLFVGVQTASAATYSRGTGVTSPAGALLYPASQDALVRILSPTASQRLSSNAATIRFELTNPDAVQGTPNFLVQMDGTDPVTTSQKQQVFTGLAAGAHTVTVELTDAAGIPVQGRRAAVQFFVAPPQAQSVTPVGNAKTAPSKRELKIGGMKFQRPDPATLDEDESNLPPASSPLPLISIIGFGVLVGGIVSAMKTRS